MAKKFLGLSALMMIVLGWAACKTKPVMPVKITYRKAILASGLVARFEDTSNEELSVIATFRNPSLNQEKSFRLDLAPGTPKEFGHLQGWNFESGDSIVLANDNYQALRASFP